MPSLSTVDEDRTAVDAVLADAGHVDEAFAARLDAGFPELHAAFARAYGAAPEGRERLTGAVGAASASWNARALDLKAFGLRRGADWLEGAVGASCYADRYAGNLAGLVDQVPRLRELHVSLLHLVDPFAVDGDRIDQRRISPALGSLTRLADVAAALCLSGVSLLLDLDGADPVDVALDALFLANHGVAAFRVDPAVDLIAALLALGAPGTAVLARARPVPLWEALATGDARMLQDAVDRATEPGTRVVRDADAVRWDFTDADADAHGYAPHAHREWLTAFLTGKVAGSPARGVRAGDGVAGTTASLAGVEADDPLGVARVILAHAITLGLPGTPLVWLGDEVAQLNDPSYRDDPARRDDPRWIHRGQQPRDRYAARRDPATAAGRVFAALTALTAARAAAPEFRGTVLLPFHVPDAAVVGFQRPTSGSVVLVLGNCSPDSVRVDAQTLSGFPPAAHDVVTGAETDLSDGLILPPCGAAWLRLASR